MSEIEVIVESGEIACDEKAAYRRPRLTIYGSVRAMTGASSGTVGDGQGMSMAASDPVVKENILRVGDHPAGFGFYLFEYKARFRDTFGHGRQFGVMADEVLGIVPDAVSRDGDGVLRVNYAMLGITRH